MVTKNVVILYKKKITEILLLLLKLIRDAPDIRPDNPAFFISGIRPDTRLFCRISDKAGYRISG
jgi:hypothetical protein